MLCVCGTMGPPVAVVLVRVRGKERNRAVECCRLLGLQHAAFVCFSLWFGSGVAFMHYEYGVLVGHMSVYRLLCVS